MKSTRANQLHVFLSGALWSLFLPTVLGLSSQTFGQSVQFQKPSQAMPASSAGVRFQPAEQAEPAQKADDRSTSANQPTAKQAANRDATQSDATQSVDSTETPVPELEVPHVTARPVNKSTRRDDNILFATYEDDDYHAGAYEVGDPSWGLPSQMMHGGARRGPRLGMEASCAIADPGCGLVDPGCGIGEPGCAIYEPTCGCGEPSCGVAEPGCGTVVGRPGPDYWCFPVCLPRFKDFTAWAGVQGFRGPRDFANNRSDSNFGFHQGVNFSGRAPLVSFLFPQLSYQAGYQAMQSRLSGTVDGPDDRLQQFVTIGLFRRVDSGLQFGAAWDMMRDELDNQIDLYQIRYELSFKGMQGNEFGARASHSTNSAISGGVEFEAVDQFALFFRRSFAQGYECRFWGGATGDGNGLIGGDFYAALNDRWSLQTGFNYLIPKEDAGPLGVAEESWNLGINVVWHMGRTAKSGTRSPHRPLMPVADNGWMFVKPVN